MKRSLAVVRAGLVLALAQACTPSAPSKQLAIRSLLDFEAGTQVSHVGVYVLHLGRDGAVRATWGEERQAEADGPFAAPVDAWPELQPEAGESLHVTVVAYGPNRQREVRAMAAHQATIPASGESQWLRTELSWIDVGNVSDREPGLSLGGSRPAAALSFDPRTRFTVARPGEIAAQSLEDGRMPAETCVDVTPCLEVPQADLSGGVGGEVPPRETSSYVLPGTGCSFGTPPQSSPSSTPVIYWHGAQHVAGDFALQGDFVAQLGRDYQFAASGAVAFDPALCVESPVDVSAPPPPAYSLISVACDVTAESAPARCRDSAVRLSPVRKSSRFLLPGQAGEPPPGQPQLSFGDVALTAPPTFLVAAEGDRLALAFGHAGQLVVRRGSRYYEGVAWAPSELTELPGSVQVRQVHAVGAHLAAPRIFFSGTDGIVHGHTDDGGWNLDLSFCEEDAGCTNQADVAGVLSATADHGVLWVLRTSEGLAVYRETDAARADRIVSDGLSDVARVLEPLDDGTGMVLIVERASGAWDLVRTDLASGTTKVVPIETTEMLLHAARGASGGRPEQIDGLHVLTATGEYRLAASAESATLVAVQPRESSGASWYGRGSSGFYDDGQRESCALHGTQLRCWQPERSVETAEGVFAAAFFSDFRGVLVEAWAGRYRLDMRYFGPIFP